MAFCPGCGSAVLEPEQAEGHDQPARGLITDPTPAETTRQDPRVTPGAVGLAAPAEELPEAPLSGAGAASLGAEPPSLGTRIRRRVTPRGLRAAALVCAAVALITAGFGGGWLVASDRAYTEAEAVGASSSQAPSEPGDDALPDMPDVRGLGERDARQILADLGVTASSVTATPQDAAGESGVVLAQDPVYGYEITGPIELTVSTPATVPVFAGRDAQDVISELDRLGAQVTTVSRYAPDVEVGEIVSLSASPGSTLPGSMRVVVAAAPDEVALTSLEAVNDNCYTDSDSLDGTTYDDLLSCSPYDGALDQTYVLGRHASRLRVVVGIPDSSTTQGGGHVTVIGDGRLLREVDAVYGTPVTVTADVSGVLRLTLRVTNSDDETSVALAEPTVIGDARQMAALTAGVIP